MKNLYLIKKWIYRYIPMDSREFTTVEYHTNESSLGKIGYEEAVTTNREIVAIHLAYTHLYMFLVEGLYV